MNRRPLAELAGRQLPAVAIFAVVVQVHAGLALRGLYADGAYFAVQIAATQDFFLHPARWVSQMVTQAPVLAAMHLGLQAPHAIAQAFSLSTNLLPGLIILLCLPAIPAGERHFFAFPASAYFAGILGAQFASVTEGLVATALFWLALCLVVFGRLSAWRLAGILALAASTSRAHEAMGFLAPMLALACLLRRSTETSPGIRAALLAACILAFAGAVAAADMIIHPVDATERGWFMDSFMAGEWLFSRRAGWNTPWLMSAAAIGTLLALLVCPRWRHAWVALFAAVALMLTAAAFHVDDLIAPETHFAARHNASLMSLPLAGLLLFVRRRSYATQKLATRPVQAVVAVLGLAISLWHVAATRQWGVFLHQFGQTLQANTGMIALGWIANRQGSPRQRLAARMTTSWTNPALSIVALPRGCIGSIIVNPARIRWQPYNPARIETMPRLRGVTYTYLYPPELQPACLSQSTLLP